MGTNKNKMATWPIPKLLFSMGLPAVFSMLIQALYNIVDSIFISNYSQDALFAVGLAYPVQVISLSLALGLGIGTGALVSRRLGEGKVDEPGRVATTGIVLSLIQSAIVMVAAFFITRPFLGMFTNRPEIIELGYQYLIYILVINIGQMASITFERILQAQGNMLIPTISLLIGSITNIILDPILIFGMFGMPEMGVKGAAIATVIGQCLSMLFCGYVVIFGEHAVKINFKGFKFEKRIIKDIYAVGLPTAVINMVGSFTTTMLNRILVNFSELAVTSLSIYFKLQSFVFMPVFGFNQGALPILSYNYGANNAKRYKDTAILYLLSALTFMTIGTIAFRFAPDALLHFFEMDANLQAISRVTLQTIALSFIPAGVSIVISTIFQSFGKGTTSMMQSILRQVGILIPMAYLLAQFGVLDYVWYAYPIAETAVIVIYIPLVIRTYHKVFNQHLAN